MQGIDILKIVVIGVMLISCRHHPDAVYQRGSDVVREDDLSFKSRQKIYQLKQEYHRELVDLVRAELIEDELIHRAAEQGKTLEVARSEAFPKYEPSKEQVKAYYDQKRKKLPYSYYQSRAEIKNVLIGLERRKRENKLLRAAEARGEVTILAEAPEAPKAAVATQDFPGKGEESAPVTIVEFADFSCPICRKAAPELKKLVAKYGDRVRFVYRYFHAHDSKLAENLSVGGHCAHRQGRFWEYHDHIFIKSKYVYSFEAKKLAKAVGLDEASFVACTQSDEARTFVRRSHLEGETLGVASTPAIFVNGEKAAGYSQEVLGRMIEAH